LTPDPFRFETAAFEPILRPTVAQKHHHSTE
jgi:hypothetical protein